MHLGDLRHGIRDGNVGEIVYISDKWFCTYQSWTENCVYWLELELGNQNNGPTVWRTATSGHEYAVFDN
jgi:hypothetical protein